MNFRKKVEVEKNKLRGYKRDGDFNMIKILETDKIKNFLFLKLIRKER